MSFSISLSDLSVEQKESIMKEYILYTTSFYLGTKERIVCFRIENGKIYLPLGSWYKFLANSPNCVDVNTNVEFLGTLYSKSTDVKGRDQDVIVEKALKSLRRHKTCFLNLPTAMGKTCIASCITSMLKKKTLFISCLTTINEQTVDEYKKFTNSKVKLLKGKVEKDPLVDVYISGSKKAWNILLKDPHFFEDIGLVIVDEAHLNTKFIFSELLLRLHPEYLLAMTATFDRKDGLEKIFNLYFGNNFSKTVSTEQLIVRKETKNFLVVKLVTDFEPTCHRMISKGKSTLNWSKVITSLCDNEDRNNLIVSLINKFAPNEKVLVLCGRISQRDYICERISKEFSVCCVKKGSKDIDRSKDVLIGTSKKLGVGFNDPSRTLLIIASNIADVRQSEGRIRTCGNKIIDIVDNNKTLEKHWNQRKRWYLSRGGEIVVKNIKL